MEDSGADLLTTTELARKLRVSDREIRQLAQSHRLPSYRVGRQLRFDLTEVLTAIRSREVP